MKELPKGFIVQDVRVAFLGEQIQTESGFMIADEGDYILESKDGRKMVIRADQIKEYRKD